MNSEILQKHIPSKTYVDYLNEIGHEFTDFETAAILSHIYEWDLAKLVKVLSEYLPAVKDEEVRRQIEELVEEKQRDMSAFADNDGEKYVFVVSVIYERSGRYRDTTVKTCTLDYSLAYRACKEYAAGEGWDDDDDVAGMSIQKFLLKKDTCVKAGDEGDGLEYISEKEYEYFNPFLFPGTPMEELRFEVDGREEVGEITMSKKGDIRHLWVKEEKTEESVRHHYDPTLFYNAYIHYPNPFELGDIVRLAEPEEGQTKSKYSKKIGIIYESQEQYKAFEERVRNGEFAPGTIDQFDTGTTVEWLTERGGFAHDHDKRIFLEKYEMPDDDPRKDLMEAASWLIQGKGGLDFFTMQLENYKDNKLNWENNNE